MKGGIGIRQREVMHTMARFGDGIWKPEWCLPFHKRELLDSLVRRGCVAVVRHSSGAWVYQLMMDPREVAL
jgi:hypothetical protein